jgi:pimeloyl-ACP methyl ester carboxylesterase
VAALRRIAIIGAADPVVTPAYSRTVCPVRLGVDPVVVPGGHSPFLARPAELADALVSTLANTG